MDPYHPYEGRKRTHQHVYPSATTFAGWETVTTISLLVPMGTRAFTGSRAPQVLYIWIREGASHYVIVTGACCCCPVENLARVNDFYCLRTERFLHLFGAQQENR